MVLAWLYGPPIYLRTPDISTPHKYVPARVLDVDTVFELADAMNAAIGTRSTRFIVSRPGRHDEIVREDVRGLAPVDLTRLSLQASAKFGLNAQQATVSFERHQPFVWATDVELEDPDEGTPRRTSTNATLEADLIRRISEGGRRLVNWRPIIAALVFLPALLLAVSWTAAEVAGDIRGALHVFGWVMVGLAGAAGAFAYKQLAGYRIQRRGHQIRIISREEIAADRANARRDIRVAVITAPIGIAAGVALALVTNTFGLK